MTTEIIDQIAQFIDEHNLNLVESEKYNYRYRIVRKGESERTTMFILNVVPKVLQPWMPDRAPYDIHITKNYIGNDALESIKNDIEVIKELDSFADIMEYQPFSDDCEEGFRRAIMLKMPIDLRSSTDNLFGKHNGVAWNAKPLVKRLNINAYGALRMCINKSYSRINIQEAKNAVNIIHKASLIYNKLSL